jgi:hypothetical protein
VKTTIPLLLALALAPVLRGEEAKKAPPAKGPRISVEPASFDFGRALPHKTLEKEFSIRNFGSEDLLIENVSTTCGCTVAENSYAKVIKPGGSTQLRVRLETRDYRGRIERRVLIRSNDPAASLTELKVEVTVEPPK